LKVSLIFIRDKRFYSHPSEKFLSQRKLNPCFGEGRHYVFGEPPLGIMYLSSVLKAAGHEVSLTDQSHPEYSDDRFIAVLQADRPALVGISFLSNMCYQAAVSLARKVKAALPSAQIVFGGVFPTINARKIIENEPAVDIVARGEGEGIIRDLGDRLGDPGSIPGIVFRSAPGEAVETLLRDPIDDLDSIPFPDRDSLDIDFVAALPLDVPAVIWDRPYTSLLSSRGCPFACIYCNCPTFSGRKCRSRSIGNVLSELEEIHQKGYRAFTFMDDNFLLNPDRAASICAGMRSRRFSFKWGCEGRAEHTAKSIFNQLSAAGCDLVMFGIESGSQRVLNRLNKGTKLLDVETAIRDAKRAGIGIIHGFFIVGVPGETVEDVEASFRFAQRVPINSFAFNSLTAFRGTPLWKDAVENGFINDEKDWDKMFPIHAIDPDAIDSQTLFKLRSVLLRTLIRNKIVRHPFRAFRLFKRFLISMSLKDLFGFLTSSTSDHTRKRV
jgi:radical SAM superfamily enzyme YgiQ (UPF0313 family)